MAEILVASHASLECVALEAYELLASEPLTKENLAAAFAMVASANPSPDTLRSQHIDEFVSSRMVQDKMPSSFSDFVAQHNALVDLCLWQNAYRSSKRPSSEALAAAATTTGVESPTRPSGRRSSVRSQRISSRLEETAEDCEAMRLMRAAERRSRAQVPSVAVRSAGIRNCVATAETSNLAPAVMDWRITTSRLRVVAGRRLARRAA